jgi:hypothetical protein
MSGNDATGDGSASRPFRSIARGWRAIRDGVGDWLLLERAGVWNEMLSIDRSGFDRDHPLLVGAYGVGARPRVTGGVQSGWARRTSHVTVRSLEAIPTGWSPGAPPVAGSGFACWGGSNHGWVYEDCVAAGWDGDWLVDAPEYQSLGNHRDVTIRGCHAYESRNLMYLNRTDNVLVEHCWFDQTGSGVRNGHAIYLQMFNGMTVIRDCAFTRIGAFNAINQRNGLALIENNYGYECVDFIASGGIATGNPHPYANGVKHVIRFNVCERPLSNGYSLVAAGRTRHGIGPSLFEHNLLANMRVDSQNPAALLLGLNRESGVGIHDLTVRHNVLVAHPAGAVVLQSLSAANSSNIRFHDNRVNVIGASVHGSAHAVYEAGSLPPTEFHSHDNILHTVATGRARFQWNNVGLDFQEFTALIGDPITGGNASVFADPAPTFTDPGRTGARYVDVVERRSGATHDDLIRRFRAQTLGGWDPRYSVPALNEWIRAGFGMARLD